jgi:hypothetical protein
MSYEQTFRRVAPNHDPGEIEEIVRLQHGGCLDSLTREELEESTEIAADVIDALNAVS